MAALPVARGRVSRTTRGPWDPRSLACDAGERTAREGAARARYPTPGQDPQRSAIHPHRVDIK
jgi:hypothetical protein